MLKQTEKVLTGTGSFFTAFTFDVNQNNDIISANFSGGNILQGKLIGILDRNRIVTLRYSYITLLNELKSGNTAFPLAVSEESLRICDAWNWLGLEQRQESLSVNDDVKLMLAELLRKHFG